MDTINKKLEDACMRDKLDDVKRLIKHAATNMTFYFHIACMYNSINVIRYLSDVVNLNTICIGIKSAVGSKHLELAKTLIQHLHNTYCTMSNADECASCQLVNNDEYKAMLNDCLYTASRLGLLSAAQYFDNLGATWHVDALICACQLADYNYAVISWLLNHDKCKPHVYQLRACLDISKRINMGSVPDRYNNIITTGLLTAELLNKGESKDDYPFAYAVIQHTQNVCNRVSKTIYDLNLPMYDNNVSKIICEYIPYSYTQQQN